jgi:hypothetical protein
MKILGVVKARVTLKEWVVAVARAAAVLLAKHAVDARHVRHVAVDVLKIPSGAVRTRL